MTDENRSGEETAPGEPGQSSSFKDHLHSSLMSASAHSDYIYEHLRHDLGRRHTALRMAVTMRDSLKQLAHLLRGEDLDTRDLRRDREAEIFIRLKKLQAYIATNNPMGIPVRDPQYIMVEIQEVLNYISEDSNVN